MKIIAVGRMKTPYKQLALDFQKRIKKRLNIVEVLETNKFRETREIIKRLRDSKGKKILFDVKGKTVSPDFFEKLPWNAVLIIGGPDGVDESLYEHVDEVVSISPLTFNHQLFRIMILEQIYRAQTNSKYKSH